MTKDQLSGRSWLRAIGIGLGVAVLTALVAGAMVTMPGRHGAT